MLLSAIALCLALTMMPQSADAMVAWSINRNPNGFVNMTPGGMFATQSTIRATDATSTETVYTQYVVGGAVFTSAAGTIEPDGFYTSDITISFNSTVINACQGGVISASFQIVRILPDESTEIAYDLPWSPPCSLADGAPAFVTPVWPPVVTVCGPDNDSVITDGQPQGVVLVSDGDWFEGSRTVVYGAAENFVREGQSEFNFIDENTPCVIDAPLPPLQSEVCGPNNDMVTLQNPSGDQMVVTDFGWTEGERTITFSASEGFVFPADAVTEFAFTDRNVACVVEPEPPTEPIGKTVTILLETSDGGSIEGTSYLLYAPVASQVSSGVYTEGLIAANNQIVLDGMTAGDYRLVVTPAGYEPIDTIVTVNGGAEAQEIVVSVTAFQSQVIPTPVPTEVPSESVTESAVTGLPETGAGSTENGTMMTLLVATFVGLVIASAGRKSIRS